MYSSAVFTGGRPLCTQILSGQGHPHKPFLTSETGLPDDKDRIPLRSLVLTQYRSVTNQWRQKGGRKGAHAPSGTVQGRERHLEGRKYGVMNLAASGELAFALQIVISYSPVTPP